MPRSAEGEGPPPFAQRLHDLARLLTRLYDASEGRILLDGRDLRDYDLDALRARTGVIFQDFVRFDLTAGDTIAVGRITARADEGRIDTAASRGLADMGAASIERIQDQASPPFS